MSEPQKPLSEKGKENWDKIFGKEETKECHCSMRIKLVGDGCSVCNPEYWEDMIDEEE